MGRHNEQEEEEEEEKTIRTSVIIHRVALLPRLATSTVRSFDSVGSVGSKSLYTVQ